MITRGNRIEKFQVKKEVELIWSHVSTQPEINEIRRSWNEIDNKIEIKSMFITLIRSLIPSEIATRKKMVLLRQQS